MLEDNTYTKYIAAGSPFTPPIVLHRLAEDSSPLIRRRVAENPQCNFETLQLLAADLDPDVRISLIDNPLAPSQLLVALCIDGSPDVRHALAECHQIETEILELLKQDENPYVRARAEKTLQRIKQPDKATVELPKNFFAEKKLDKRA